MYRKTALSLALSLGALLLCMPASSMPAGPSANQATANASEGLVEEVRHRKWRKHRHFSHRRHWRRHHAHRRHWRHRRHRHFYYYPYYSYDPYYPYYYPYYYRRRPGFSIYLHF